MNELRQRQPRERDEAWLAYVRTLPCLICGKPGSDPAHIRAPSLEHGKRYTGKAEKPDDRWVLPLCREHHDAQHRHNEVEWWASYGIDPFERAIELYASRPGADKPKRERRRERKTKPRPPSDKRTKIVGRTEIQSRGFGEQHRPMRGRNLKQEKH